MSVTNSMGSDEMEMVMTVDAMPYELSIDVPTVALVNTPVVFDFTSSSSLIAWNWDLGIEGAFYTINLTHTFENTGEYPVVLTGINNAGCEVRVELTINVLLESDTENAEILSLFEVYPNPTSGHVTIAVALPQSEDTELLIYNALGQLLRSEKQSNQTSYQQNLDLNNLPAGQYFFLLFVNGEIMGRERLVIE